MMVRLLVVGKTDMPWVRAGLDLYASRIVHYVRFEVKEIPELKNVGALSEAQIKEKEGALILKEATKGGRNSVPWSSHQNCRSASAAGARTCAS